MANISSMKKNSPNKNDNKLKQSKCNMKKKGTKKRKTDEEESVNKVDKRVKCYASEEQKRAAMEKAERIKEELASQNSICFLKVLGRTHVSSGFWLSLPAAFCKKQLPRHDVKIFLVADGEEEEKEEEEINYLAKKYGLSGGWRGFAIDHGLLEGDVLVFHKLMLLEGDVLAIEPASKIKFRVHISRAINIDQPTTTSTLSSSTTTAKDDNDDAPSMNVMIEKISGARPCCLSEFNDKEQKMRHLESRLANVRLSLEKHAREIRSEAVEFRAAFSKAAAAPWTKYNPPHNLI